MPCPFGFSGPNPHEGEGEDEELDNVGEDMNKEKDECVQATSDKDPQAKAKRKKKDKLAAEAEEDDSFDYDKDPVRWFYQNQIKSEKDFQKRKASLRELARKRLDDIMAKKGKGIGWPEDDSDLDSLSIRSSELSDLDSDVHSLCSLRSCAHSWVQEARYPTNAENTLKFVSLSALAVVAYLVYQAYLALTAARRVHGVIVHPHWPGLTFASAGASGLALLLANLAARQRSKRLLLSSQVMLTLTYAAAVVLTCLTHLSPTGVDAKLQEAACTKYGKGDKGSKLCRMLPGITRELAEHMQHMMWANVALAVMAVGTLAVSIWYIFELAYIEKRAIKHRRRHKRRKHSIPWDKIKVIGPVMKCGAGGAGSAGKAGGGGKCPMGFAAAASTSAATKKTQ